MTPIMSTRFPAFVCSVMKRASSRALEAATTDWGPAPAPTYTRLLLPPMLKPFESS